MPSGVILSVRRDDRPPCTLDRFSSFSANVSHLSTLLNADDGDGKVDNLHLLMIALRDV